MAVAPFLFSSLLLCGFAHLSMAEPLRATSTPALSVNAVVPQVIAVADQITANGSVAAWQEASIGAQTNALRLTEVRVNVGDVVKRGQILAQFDSSTLKADLAEARAWVAQADAALAEARAESKRARELQANGFISEQKVTQALTAENSALARLEAQRALLQTRELHLAQTQVQAPDAGIISARSATVGAVAAPGQELFRLIRQGRLEWRAEVSSADLARLKPRMPVVLTLPGGESVQGRLRTIAPTVDPQTRNGLVYVDLPRQGVARAGMFARGQFQLASAQALTLPQTAILQRDGFAYVWRLEPVQQAQAAVNKAPLAQATLTKVTLGRRTADRVEIAAGLSPTARVVAKGGAFLTDGDLVRVVGDQAR